jgi:hypothetical protein
MEAAKVRLRPIYLTWRCEMKLLAFALTEGSSKACAHGLWR